MVRDISLSLIFINNLLQFILEMPPPKWQDFPLVKEYIDVYSINFKGKMKKKCKKSVFLHLTYKISSK